MIGVGEGGLGVLRRIVAGNELGFGFKWLV